MRFLHLQRLHVRPRRVAKHLPSVAWSKTLSAQSPWLDFLIRARYLLEIGNKIALTARRSKAKILICASSRVMNVGR